MVLPPTEVSGTPSVLSNDLDVVLARNGLVEVEVFTPEKFTDRVKSNWPDWSKPTST